MADTGGQDIGQLALSQQTATANADSTQVKPTNQNISVRVLSPGDDGTVTQSNSSAALAAAANANTTGQSAQQAGAGAAQQAIGQLAANGQSADAYAESTQVKPTNRNISVRVLSPGDDGDGHAVQQVAGERAGGQRERHRPVRPPVGGGDGVQTIGQAAASRQDASSDAQSEQIHPTNVNVPVRVLSPGGNGSVKQENTSAALSAALNKDETTQDAAQSQGGSCGCEEARSSAKPKLAPSRDQSCGCQKDGMAMQAIGQAAFNQQSADSTASSKQIGAKNSTRRSACSAPETKARSRSATTRRRCRWRRTGTPPASPPTSGWATAAGATGSPSRHRAARQERAVRPVRRHLAPDRSRRTSTPPPTCSARAARRRLRLRAEGRQRLPRGARSHRRRRCALWAAGPQREAARRRGAGPSGRLGGPGEPVRRAVRGLNANALEQLAGQQA